jgi:hypothetical protein
MGDRDQLDPLIQHPGQCRQIDLSPGRDRNRQHFGTGAHRHHLPGDNIGMMFEGRYQNPVARREVHSPPTGCHQVNCLGRAPGPDDLLRKRAVQKCRDGPAGVFKCGGRSVGKGVRTPMDVGIVAAIVVADGGDDDFRLLRCSGVIQIHQRLTIHKLVQDGELGTNVLNVESGSNRAHGGAHAVAATDCDPRSNRPLIAGRR